MKPLMLFSRLWQSLGLSVVQVLFRLCSEPPRPALGDALGLALPWRLPSTYDMVRDAAQGLEDTAHERALLARCGM